MAEDGEEYQAPIDALGENLLSLAGQLGAGMAEAMREPRYEYRLAVWDEVNPLAADGWELRAAHVELTSFIMSRKLGPADEAAAVAAEAAAKAAFGLPGRPKVSPEHLEAHRRLGTDCALNQPEDGTGRPG